MGSFLPNIFAGSGGSSSIVSSVISEGVRSERKRKGAEKKEKKTLLAAQQDEATQLQTAAQDRQKLLQIGAQSQIATTSRGVLGEPTTGRRRLRI